MLDKVTVIVLVFVCLTAASPASCQAQGPSVSQIEKTQQDLEMEKALRTEVEKCQKVFIKKIIVEGATLITEEQIKEIIPPFQKHWLTKEDIQRIVDLPEKRRKAPIFMYGDIRRLTQSVNN